jgi:hypothetical protein
MDKYEVIVSNIGTVYSGMDKAQAEREYAECVELSQGEFGRISGESVTLMRNHEPIKEHHGNQANEE